MLVQHILKGKADDGVVTVPPGTSVGQAAEILSARRIGTLVISADGKTLQGILSERDIVREVGRRAGACLNDPVESLMTRSVVSCSRNDSAEAVLTKMTRGRFRHMPVLEEGEMVGLISIGDVVKARLDELHMEKEALTGMIMGN